MLQEQGVGLVLQLDPHAAPKLTNPEEEEDGEALGRLLGTVSPRGCGVWPTDAGHPDLGPVEWERGGRRVSFDYTLGGDGEGVAVVRHHWYYGWRDFAVPGRKDDGLVLELAREAVGVIRCDFLACLALRLPCCASTPSHTCLCHATRQHTQPVFRLRIGLPFSNSVSFPPHTQPNHTGRVARWWWPATAGGGGRARSPR